MLHEISYEKATDNIFDFFLNDSIITAPHQYCDYIENFIGALNEIYRYKRIINKEVADRDVKKFRNNWTVRVYINASNPYCKVLDGIMSEVLITAGCTKQVSLLCLPNDIKCKICDNYDKPFNNCLVIEGKFKLKNSKLIEYDDISYEYIFWNYYLTTSVKPHVMYCDDDFSFIVHPKDIYRVTNIIDSTILKNSAGITYTDKCMKIVEDDTNYPKINIYKKGANVDER